jgi:hypothetical protein
MKIQNIKQVTKLAYLHAQASKALIDIRNILNKYNSETDGSGLSNNQLYSLYIGTFPDGSGFQANLTGLCIGLKTLRFVSEELEKRIELYNEELEKL